MPTDRAAVEVCSQMAVETSMPGTGIQIVPIVDAVKWYGVAIGGTRSHVLKCSDGHSYLVKGQHNPQGPRILANELLANLLLRKLDIATPEAAIVSVTARFIEKNRAMQTTSDASPRPWAAGLSFGSRVSTWGWPSLSACPMFDLIPDRLLPRVENLQDFTNVLVFDAWAGQRDARQAVFVRRRLGQTFTVHMIDNGLCFGGMNWKFQEFSPIYIYLQPSVYDSVMGPDAFEMIIRKFERRICSSSLKAAASNIPAAWLDQGIETFEELLANLASRVSKLRLFVEALRNYKLQPFHSWVNSGRSQPRAALADIRKRILDEGCLLPKFTQ
jgi:hypothetical protein